MTTLTYEIEIVLPAGSPAPDADGLAEAVEQDLIREAVDPSEVHARRLEPIGGGFRLDVELGNDAMRSPEHVADVLRDVADRLSSPNTRRGNVRDVNGNTVGRYALELPAPEPEDGERYTAAELEELPTIAEGQADDLKIETASTRVWLSRCSVEDGEPFNDKVTVERLQSGRWVEEEVYAG